MFFRLLIYVLLGLSTLNCGMDDNKKNDEPMRRFSCDSDDLVYTAPTSPPEGLVDHSYTKMTSLYGVPIVGSNEVPDKTFEMVWNQVNLMLENRRDILCAIAKNGIVISLIGEDEVPTDIPEYSDLDPSYWNTRARGYGPTPLRPAVSAPEENILCYGGNPVVNSNIHIFIHEFAHAIHLGGLDSMYPEFSEKTNSGFDSRLKKLYQAAKKSGIYNSDAYAMTNRKEYWAVGVTAYFNANNVFPKDRTELLNDDPDLHDLIVEFLKTSKDLKLCPD